MKKVTISAIVSTVTLWLGFVGSKLALAQTRCMLNGREVPCGELKEQVGGFLGLGIAMVFVFIALGIWATVFWIMMIVHVAKHNVENRAMWIVLLVFTGVIGALIYYFAVKRKFVEQTAVVQPPMQPPATTMSQ